jgi:hypothetical protein
MIYFKYEYDGTDEGMQELITLHSDQYLREVQNITEGNFLIFTDTLTVEEALESRVSNIESEISPVIESVSLGDRVTAIEETLLVII